MDCQKAQYLIQEYLEKELDADERAELAQHLLECTECREEMNQMERADTYFSRQSWLPPPESLRENIMAALSFTHPEVQDSPEKSTHRFRYILLSLGQLILAASLLIIIRPKWPLPTTWTRFLSRIGTVGKEWSLVLKTAGERLLELIHLNEVSFGDGTYGFLIQSPWVKLSLLSISLILTLYLNGRLLLAGKHISKKV
ncbi:anti-sigma factor family protein [Candidatus Poribacteria bacterium]